MRHGLVGRRNFYKSRNLSKLPEVNQNTPQLPIMGDFFAVKDIFDDGRSHKIAKRVISTKNHTQPFALSFTEGFFGCLLIGWLEGGPIADLVEIFRISGGFTVVPCLQFLLLVSVT